jgi:hypothetical protein
MPWKKCHVMDERLRFVARLLEGEKMAPLCAELGISRKTGYKIFGRRRSRSARWRYENCPVIGPSPGRANRRLDSRPRANFHPSSS